MPSTIAQQFMDALQEIEKTRTVDAIVQLFSDDATLARLSHVGDYQGSDGADRFWREYLGTFKSLETTFHSVIEDGEQVTLEWESRGELLNGDPLHYCGVSLFSVADDKVTSFRTYYDSASFLPKGSRQS
ncbi:MAG: nuclear transport factor 2 family protein [Trueperaceae bacterium]|nr:nuclear transport factor 2 family protein [Trueperaceae bacterium]